MTNFKKISVAIMTFLIAACTQQQQDQLCPPSVNRKFGLDVQSIYVIKHEDPAIQGNSDEPYIMNIGFRSTLGRHCSTVV